jgi:hypothetical protein
MSYPRDEMATDQYRYPYGKKLRAGDRWQVGGRWVEWNGVCVIGHCGFRFSGAEFRAWANSATALEVDSDWEISTRREKEAACIAQQMVAEGMVPDAD